MTETATVLALLGIIAFIIVTYFVIKNDKNSVWHRATARVFYLFVLIPINYLTFYIMEIAAPAIQPAFEAFFIIVFVASILYFIVAFVLFFVKGTTELVSNSYVESETRLK